MLQTFRIHLLNRFLFLLLCIMIPFLVERQCIATENWKARGVAPGQGKLLIVTPQRLASGFQGFVDFKSTIRPTELVILEEVLSQTKGDDEAEQLKRYLYTKWTEENFEFVLLVGDVSVMPVRYMVLDRVTEPAFDYAFYPSDLYYADLAKKDGSFESWNGNREGYHARYFGEVRGEKNKNDPINFDGVDYLPEVHVGRWPIESLEEVERMVAKSILYEKAIREDREASHRRSALVAVGGWVDTRGLFDQFATKLDSRWKLEKSYYSDRRKGVGEPPSHEGIQKFFNSGIGLLIHAGHGQPTEWDQCFSLSDLQKISNHQNLPIVVSAGCSTAYFATLPPYESYIDMEGHHHRGTNLGERFLEPPPPPACIQPGEFNGTGLGEQLLRRSENGSVAYIGCNTGSQPCGLTLVEGFVESIAESENPTVGGSWSDALGHYHRVQNLSSLKPDADWYPPSIFFQGMKFMVFGDPSLPLPGAKTGKPSGS